MEKEYFLRWVVPWDYIVPLCKYNYDDKQRWHSGYAIFHWRNKLDEDLSKESRQKNTEKVSTVQIDEHEFRCVQTVCGQEGWKGNVEK